MINLSGQVREVGSGIKSKSAWWERKHGDNANTSSWIFKRTTKSFLLELARTIQLLSLWTQ